jgi:hypothetical protein
VSQWNLAVQLTGQGSDLASTLRDSAKEARKLTQRINDAKQALAELRAAAAGDIKVRLDLDADHLRADVTAALTAAGSGQGLNLRLDIDAAHLRTDVTSALTDASTGQDLRIRLGVDADHLRTDISAALTDASSGHDLRVRLDVDAAHLRADVEGALTAAAAGHDLRVRLDVDTGHLRSDIETALTAATAGLDATVDLNVNTTGLAAVRTEAADTAHSLNVLQRAAREAKDELGELEARSLTTAAALRRINTAAGRGRTRLDGLSSSTRTFRTDLDDLDTSLVRTTGSLTGLRGVVGGLGGSGGGSRGGFRGATSALIGLSLALLPIAASVAPLAGGLVGAGAAAAAFGVAIGGQVAKLVEAAEAQKKYEDAVAEHGAASEEAAKAELARQRVLEKMPKSTQEAAAAWAALKDQYEEFSDSLADDTMPVATKGIQILTASLDEGSPMAGMFADHMDRLMNIIGGAVGSGMTDQLGEQFTAFADGALEDGLDALVRFIRVLSTDGIDTGPIGEFMDYAREVGPEVRDTLVNIAEAVVHLLAAGSDAGVSMLQIVNALAKLVDAVPTEALSALIQFVIVFKMVKLAAAGLAASSGAAAAFGAAITGMSAAAAGSVGPLAAFRAAIATLSRTAKVALAGTGIGLLVIALSELAAMSASAPPDVDKLTSSLEQLGHGGKPAGEAARAFGKDLGGLYDKVRSLTDPSTADDIQQFLVGWTGWDSTPVKEAKENVDAIDKSLANLVKNGRSDLAAAALSKLTKEYSKGGKDAGEFTKRLDDYKASVKDAEFENQLAAEAMGLFGQQAQNTTAKLNAQKLSADGLRQSIIALNDVNRAAGSAMSAFEQSIDDATEAARKHAGVLKMRDGELDLGTSKARDAEKVLSTLAANTDAAASAAREQGKSWGQVSKIYDEGRDTFIKAADDMGLTRAQAEALADSYLKIPDKKTMEVEMRSEDAMDGLNRVIGAIKKTPDAKSVTVKALTQDAILLLESLGLKVTRLKDGKFKVTAETGTAEDSLGGVRKLRDGLKNKTITIDTETADTISDLEEVKRKVASTKGKTITMKAPTAEARKQLEELGFKIRNTKGKRVVITVPTGSQKAGVDGLRGAINGLRNKSVTITTRHVTINETVNKTAGSLADAIRKQAKNARKNADGGVWDYFSDGGVQRGGVRRFAGGAENHVAQIAPAGSWRVWAEPETAGEGYVPFAASKRPRSRAITEEIVRRLGGDPTGIQWNADGSVTDWRYDPQTGSLYSASDAGSAGKKTRKVKIKGKVREIEYFDIGAVESKLKSAAKATQAWNKDLERVADRVGGDVAEALASMGADGVKLADKMAKGSTKYINQMAAALRNLQKTAKASLTDYTRQLDKANKLDKDFAKNLADLAAQGFGDLASQLAAQNDQAAMDLAAAAVKDKGKASKANKAAKTANAQLTSDQVSQLVSVIAAIKTSKTGIHDVAATTGLGEDDIIDVATKATGQIKSALGSRATRFLADLAKAQKVMAYANGGIRAGMYATQGGIIRFAEPSTHGEAYVPFAPSKRPAATSVLSDVAGRFGLGLTDARSGQVVVVREQGPLVGSQTWHVTSGGNADDTARKVDANNAYQLRRLARGGVGARA